jgi:hypothetical protein
MENMPFDGFSAGLHRLNQLAAVVKILVFSGLAAIFTELDFAGLLDWSFLRTKGQATPHANLAALRPSAASEWDRLAVVQIRKTCRSFCHRR